MENLPQWNIESEYASLSAREFQNDKMRVREISQQLDLLSCSSSDDLQKALLLADEATILNRNLHTYVHCLLNNNSMNAQARTEDSELDEIKSTYLQAFKPFSLAISKCGEIDFNKIISHPKLVGAKFYWQQQRSQSDTLLSEKEETLLTALETSGFYAWSNLYFSISGKLKVKIEDNGQVKEIGLAQAASMLRGPDEKIRKASWQGIQHAWEMQEESVASVLNALAGWRLEVNKKRAYSRPVEFLDQALFQSRIKKETLDAMFSAVGANVKELQSGLKSMAGLMGKKQADPWDLIAPSPVSHRSTSIPYAQAIEMICHSFSKVSPELSEFVRMMVKNNWIEARVLPNKASGAHCTGFEKSVTPRVFMTYGGSSHDVSTLAHELGHAYHSWILRDLHVYERDYPMTLAETASIFAETILTDELIKNAQSTEEKISYVWSEIEGAIALLLNIPSRFEFEYNFYQARKKSALSADQLKELTDSAWRKWYGNSLTLTEKMFWATKLHFSIADASFYNFPYTFGYLFALSIYARRDSLGDQFMDKYKAILRDTGRMTAEDLVEKHLGEDITQSHFWQKSIDVVLGKVKGFQEICNNFRKT